MSNKKLGKKIREQREAMSMSQAVLAKKLGVKASHIAYIENNQRRPSLSLLGRIGRVLGLDPRELFTLSHPEAKFLLSDNDEEKTSAEAENDPWQQFLANRVLLRRHKVTPSELKILKQVSLLADVSNARDFFFILNTIRQAGNPNQ